MNIQTPRAGDKALVIQPDSILRGLIVQVVSDPRDGGGYNVRTKQIYRGLLSEIVHPDGKPSPSPFWGWHLPTLGLLRIPPASEAKQQFSEQPIKEAA